MTYMGIDKAYIALILQSHKVAVKKVISRVQKHRSRYKDKITNNINAYLYLNSFRTVNPTIMNYPFKFFIKPMGKGRFLYLQENIDRTILVRDVVEILNEQKTDPDWCLNISDFKNQAISSLIFHSQIINDSYVNKEEFDILDYVFDEEFTKQTFQNLFSKLRVNNQAEFINFSQHSDIFSNALHNLTIDLIQNLKKWQNLSFDQIYQLASETPRRFKVSKERIYLDNSAFPKDLLKLSVFVLSSLTNNSNVVKKIELLHRCGIRRIQDLIIFHKPFRPIFKDANFIKKVVALDSVKYL